MDRYVYTLELTPGEWQSLLWLDARGYAADLVRCASEVDETDERVILSYTEAAAWDAVEAVVGHYDPDFTTCASGPLKVKMWEFVEGVV